MTDVLKPQTAEQVLESVQWAAASETPLEISAGGSKRAFGRPCDAIVRLDLAALSGIGLYEPAELVMGAAPAQLVEANGRKCAFLREIVRVTEAPAIVHNCRIEDLKPFAADVITARAFASLDTLIAYARPFLAGGGLCLFLKGRTAQRELTESAKNWMMAVTRIDSISDPSGVILKLEDISPRHG